MGRDEATRDGGPPSGDGPARPCRLDYSATLPPWYRRRSLWHRVLRTGLLIVGLVAVGAGYRWGPGLWKQTGYLYTQHRCMAYTAPGDQVVWEEDPTAAAGLISGGGGYRSVLRVDAGAPSAAASRPLCWRQYWDRVWDPTGRRDLREAVLFLHERTTPSGKAYLLVIEVVEPRSQHPQHLAATLIDPATYRRSFKHYGPWAVDLPLDSRLSKRFYAGQVDSADPSRFSIDYAVDGQRGTLRGRLVDGTPGGPPAEVELRISDGPPLSGE